jgi:hypothetical protein
VASDPAGVFASDEHRRAQALAPRPDEDPLAFDALRGRLALDDHLRVEPEALAELLKDLEADGDVLRVGDGYAQTEAGFAKLTGPVADEPPPLEGAALEAAEAANEKHAAEGEARAAQGRIDANRRAVEELNAAIAEDERLIAAGEEG